MSNPLRTMRQYFRPRRRSLVAAGLVLSLGIVVAWIAFSPKEPVYQGKHLGEWLGDFQGTPQQQRLAAAAFKQMGTNAIPPLLRRLANGDSRFTSLLLKLKKKWSWLKIPIEGASTRYPNVRTAFDAMGAANARHAVPQLINLLTDTPLLYSSDQRPNSITMILRRIGPPAVPPLIQALTNANAPLRFHACYTLGELRDAQAVAALCDVLKRDADVPVRCRAAIALRTIGAQPKLSVMALSEALTDPAAAVRLNAAYALLGFEKDARSAVPLLLGAIRSEASMPDRIGHPVVFTEKSKGDVIGACLAALKIIDPDAELEAKEFLRTSFSPEELPKIPNF